MTWMEPTMSDISLSAAQQAARRFVLDEAGFAQLTTIDARGYPVTRTMTVFLQDDWSVATVQRRLHRRLDQWRRSPRTEVVWTGTPRPGATNEHPHVFDLNLLPPRLVAVRGDAQIMEPDWTEAIYRTAVTAQRAAGQDRAPLRSADEVAEQLVGVLIQPVVVRLEGFGTEAQSFHFRPGQPGQGGQ